MPLAKDGAATIYHVLSSGVTTPGSGILQIQQRPTLFVGHVDFQALSASPIAVKNCTFEAEAEISMRNAELHPSDRRPGNDALIGEIIEGDCWPDSPFVQAIRCIIHSRCDNKVEKSVLVWHGTQHQCLNLDG